MPVHLPCPDRRHFLVRTASALASIVVFRAAFASSGNDPHSLALLSDPHIPDNADLVARGVNMTANLRQVVREILAAGSRPAGVIVNGDCAYLHGKPEDYANFARCLVPLNEAGFPIHVTMGNHDNRSALYGTLADQKPVSSPVESKHVGVLEFPRANWFLLDSLTATNVVTGQIGDEQRKWLAKALDERKEKPAIVMAHHTPQFTPPAEGKVWTGIEDTGPLLDVLLPRKHVKAFVFGHSHDWKLSKQGDLHLVNLPPVAYVFASGKPNGWVTASMRSDGLDLELHTIDPDHGQNREKISLVWR